VTTSANPLAAYNIAAQLLTCASDQVAEAWADVDPELSLARQCVVWGAIAWDQCECGQLVVSIAEQYPSHTFPTPATAPTATNVAQNRCGANIWVIRYEVSILRCVPVQDDQGNPPECSALDEAAQVAARDAWAVRTGIGCCLADLSRDLLPNGSTEIADYLIQDQPSRGPEGGCAGSSLNLLVGIRNCLCPPGAGSS
jgi:hypothetical protein